MKDSEIALVVDKSGSMSRAWGKTKQWMKKLVDTFKIDGKKHRVGLILWSDNVDSSQTVRFNQGLTGKTLISLTN